MEQYIIKGGNPLVGEVEIGGAKNAALPILAAAIMTDDTVTIDNLPDVNDINVLLEAIAGIGAKVKRIDRHTVQINGSGITNFDIEYDYIKKIRASYYLLGALLGKYKHSEVALPGGCNIGARPIDQHLKGFRALGAFVDIEHGKIIAEAERLVGKHLYFDVVSVGATINVMMAAVMAEGTTIMENVAKEPHVVDVANFLNKMGAKIKGAGTDTIKIEGVEKLGGARHTVIPDRIETGTFMLAAAITKGAVHIMNAVPDHVKPIIAKLRECGVRIEVGDDDIIVRADLGPQSSTDIKTLPYPGFPTDIQSPFMAYLTTVEGSGTVIETVFENRFMHVSQLNKMGAHIETAGNKATIKGNARLRGCQVMATDLRAGAALVLAGLVAEGQTEISEIYHIERGYEKFIEKFRALGAEITRIDD